MFFSDKSDLICFAWRPRSRCFSKAQIEWNGITLNGSLAVDTPIVDLSHENINALLVDLFGPLGFVELAELYSACQKHGAVFGAVNWEQFYGDNGMNWNSRTQELALKLCETADTFRDWAYARKASQLDLMPLNSLKDLEEFNALASHFAPLSRNEGKSIIDLLVDLILMGHTGSSLLGDGKQPWFNHLQQIRNPGTNAANTLDERAWPKYVQVQNFRQGDRMLKKMQITYSDGKDLSEKLSRLSTLDEN